MLRVEELVGRAASKQRIHIPTDAAVLRPEVCERDGDADAGLQRGAAVGIDNLMYPLIPKCAWRLSLGGPLTLLACGQRRQGRPAGVLKCSNNRRAKHLLASVTATCRAYQCAKWGTTRCRNTSGGTGLGLNF